MNPTQIVLHLILSLLRVIINYKRALGTYVAIHIPLLECDVVKITNKAFGFKYLSLCLHSLTVGYVNFSEFLLVIFDKSAMFQKLRAEKRQTKYDYHLVYVFLIKEELVISSIVI